MIGWLIHRWDGLSHVIYNRFARCMVTKIIKKYQAYIIHNSQSIYTIVHT